MGDEKVTVTGKMQLTVANEDQFKNGKIKQMLARAIANIVGSKTEFVEVSVQMDSRRRLAKEARRRLAPILITIAYTITADTAATASSMVGKIKNTQGDDFKNAMVKAATETGMNTFDVSSVTTVEVQKQKPSVVTTSSEKDAPKEYHRYKPFSNMAAIISKPLICQSRRKPLKCGSFFTDKYNAQRINTLYMAPLNAPRTSDILRCRSEEWSTAKHLGYEPAMYGDMPVYCVFMNEDILSKIKEFEWIDDLTDKLFLTSFIYTPGADAITMTKMNWDVFDTGRVHPTYEMRSSTVLQDSNLWGRWQVAVWSFVIVVGIRQLSLFYKCRGGKQWTMAFFLDMIFNILWFAFGIMSMLRQSLFKSVIVDKMLHLVDCFLQVEDLTDRDVIVQTVGSFLSAIDDMTDVVLREHIVKLIAFAFILISLGRTIAYMSVHPRIDVISQTLKKASDDMMHFLLIFVFVLGVFAWLAFWSFGADKQAFRSFGVSLNSCFQMLVGEYPWEDEWKEDFPQKVWWVCYTFLIYVVSLNILLAIVVESFLRVKRELENVVAERNFFVDMFYVTFVSLMRWPSGWPSHPSIEAHLFSTKVVKTSVSIDELAHSKTCQFRNKASVQNFLKVYYIILGDEALSHENKAKKEKQEQAKATLTYINEYFNVKSPTDIIRFIAMIVKIQRTFRMVVARAKKDRMLKRKLQNKVSSPSAPSAFFEKVVLV